MPVPAEKFGRYTLLHRLAIGGMGEIWLARQSGPAGFDRFIAIKRLLPNLAESLEFVQMFQDEARLAARLTHAGICQVYEFDRIGNSYYLAMEYLHGETLASMLDRSIKENKPLSQPVIAYIVAQALEGLHFAHEAKDAEGHSLGLIHRDISPSNIFVTYDGQVKLLDFGIAKAARRTIHTQAGSIKGKFGYIAPEVYKGQPIDRRVDLFSMGVVLWEMLTRRRLYNRGADYEILKAIVEEPTPDPRDADTSVSPPLAETTVKALAKFPSDRYQTALEMRRALSVYLRGLSEEMDAQHMSDVMTELYGRIWIDLRASVLDSFKEGSDSVANAEALNPTLTDARIDELTQLAIADAGGSAEHVSKPLSRNRHLPHHPTPAPGTNAWGTLLAAPVVELPIRRPSSPTLAAVVVPPPAAVRPKRSVVRIGSVVAVGLVASMMAFAALRHPVRAEPQGAQLTGSATELPLTSPPVPAERTSATAGPPALRAGEGIVPTALPTAVPMPIPAAAPAPTVLAETKTLPRKHSARHAAASSKPASHILNPDQPMEWDQK